MCEPSEQGSIDLFKSIYGIKNFDPGSAKYFPTVTKSKLKYFFICFKKLGNPAIHNKEIMLSKPNTERQICTISLMHGIFKNKQSRTLLGGGKGKILIKK